MKRISRTAAQISMLPMPDRDHIQGSINAPIKLVEYGDYECPYCGEAYPVVIEIQERLGRRLCFAFRNFPLANAHPHAEHAAEAAEAAHEQGRFWEMHDLLYENQDALADEDLAQYKLALGLDARRLIAKSRVKHTRPASGKIFAAERATASTERPIPSSTVCALMEVLTSRISSPHLLDSP
jgi:protein-disulfide isomerase